MVETWQLGPLYMHVTQTIIVQFPMFRHSLPKFIPWLCKLSLTLANSFTLPCMRAGVIRIRLHSCHIWMNLSLAYQKYRCVDVDIFYHGECCFSGDIKLPWTINYSFQPVAHIPIPGLYWGGHIHIWDKKLKWIGVFTRLENRVVATFTWTCQLKPNMPGEQVSY